MKQKIIFTALPNGINVLAKKLKISVAISLQVLEAAQGTKLGSVVDMIKWAERINKAKFLIQVNGVNVEAGRVSAPADTDDWNGLFVPTLDVFPFIQPDLTKIPIISYPVKNVQSYVQSIYEKTGNSFADDLPDMTYYTNNPLFTDISNYKIVGNPITKELDFIAEDMGRGQEVKNRLKQIPFITSENLQPGLDFAQLCNFHSMYEDKTKTAFEKFKMPEFEFHDVLSVIAQYPTLMRKLGLVIDLEIPLKVSQFPIDVKSLVRAIPMGLDLIEPTLISCPATSCLQTSTGYFTQTAEGSFHSKGYAKINTEAFTVFQVDTDGTALKLVSHIDALQLKRARHLNYLVGAKILPSSESVLAAYNNEETARREGLPSLRSSGFGIAKNNMASYLNGRFVRMQELKVKSVGGAAVPTEAGNGNVTYDLDVVLFGDDVNIGYRMDVQMHTGAAAAGEWRSLHLHNSAYSYINTFGTKITIGGIEQEEGFIQLSTSEDKAIAGPHMKVSEVIARWEGWSLAVPKPGLAVNETMADLPEGINQVDSEQIYKNNEQVYKTNEQEQKKFLTPAKADFKLNVMPSVVKGSLPKLRFGKSYSVKLRMVDLAGNSVSLGSKPADPATMVCSRAYLRFEPVDAPFLIHGNVIKDGESSEVMAIRSNEVLTVKEFEQEFSQGTIYKDRSIRHVKPPRSTVDMAITHGMFDDAFGQKSPQNKNVYDWIATKDPEVSVKEFSDGIAKFNPDAVSPVIDGDQFSSVPIEYLADPMAAGVSFFISQLDPNIKGTAAQQELYSKRCSFYHEEEITDNNENKEIPVELWKTPKTFRIVLMEGEIFNVHWNQAERKLEVSLPKGFMIKLSYACFWRPNDLEPISGVYNMIGKPDLKQAVGLRISKGRHWMFSPWRTLTLVHAVPQPIKKGNIFTKASTLPFISDLTSVRKIGDTFAGVNIDLEVHAASTGVVDIEGTWTDWIDDPDDRFFNGIHKVVKTAKVFHYSSLYHIYNYVFGDFPNKNIKNNKFTAIPHHFNDTRHRWVEYKVIASTRYKEYFFNLINSKKENFPITSVSNVFKVNVLSSARPNPPQIAYVIPTFDWIKVVNESTTTKIRVGGLRVYLKRPWFSSGEDEKLAVVLIPGDSELQKTALKANEALTEKLYTSYGFDPTKTPPPPPPQQPTSPPPPLFLPKSVFILSPKLVAKNPEFNDDLSISELDSLRADVVAFDVNYDQDRQLHYADIRITMPDYFPFIRLALAAYQQHSVAENSTDCCLSKIVQADYIQVPPARQTSMNKNGNKVTITISGTAPRTYVTDNFYMKVEMILEALSIPQSESVSISIDEKPISTFSAAVNKGDDVNVSHDFLLPRDYAKQAYRIKIMEYEVISGDPDRFKSSDGAPLPGIEKMNKRLVFSDVYEISPFRQKVNPF